MRQQLKETEAICSKLKATTEDYRQKLEQEVLLRDKERVQYREQITKLEGKVQSAEHASKAAQEAATSAEVQMQAREKHALKLQERNRELEEELTRTSNEYRALKSTVEDHRRRAAEEFERVRAIEPLSAAPWENVGALTMTIIQCLVGSQLRQQDRAEQEESRKLADQLSHRLSDREDALRQVTVLSDSDM